MYSAVGEFDCANAPMATGSKRCPFAPGVRSSAAGGDLWCLGLLRVGGHRPRAWLLVEPSRPACDPLRRARERCAHGARAPGHARCHRGKRARTLASNFTSGSAGLQRVRGWENSHAFTKRRDQAGEGGQGERAGHLEDPWR